MKKLLLILFVIIIVSIPATATPYDVFNAFGVMPNTKNPANRNVPTFVLNAGVSLESDDLNYQLIPLLNADWDKEEREWVGSLVGENGLNVSAHALPSIGLNIGFLGLHADGKASGTVSIPKHFTDLAFYGHDAEKLIEEESIKYEFDDLNGHGAGYAEAGITLAHTTKSGLTMGLAAKYLYGLGFVDARGSGKIVTSHKEQSTAITGKDVAFTTFHSLEGKGYSFDVGARYQINSIFALDLSLLNIGQIQWSNGEENRFYRDGDVTLIDFGFNVDEFEFVFETDESEEPFLEEKKVDQNYTWKLPRVVRLGADLMATRSLRLAGEVSHTTYFEYPEQKTTSLEFAGGVEYRLLWIFPVRITAQKELKEKAIVNGGLGINLGFINVDASITNILGFITEDSRGFGLGLSTTLKF